MPQINLQEGVKEALRIINEYGIEVTEIYINEAKIKEVNATDVEGIESKGARRVGAERVPPFPPWLGQYPVEDVYFSAKNKKGILFVIGAIYPPRGKTIIVATYTRAYRIGASFPPQTPSMFLPLIKYVLLIFDSLNYVKPSRIDFGAFLKELKIKYEELGRTIEVDLETVTPQEWKEIKSWMRAVSLYEELKKALITRLKKRLTQRVLRKHSEGDAALQEATEYAFKVFLKELSQDLLRSWRSFTKFSDEDVIDDEVLKMIDEVETEMRAPEPNYLKTAHFLASITTSGDTVERIFRHSTNMFGLSITGADVYKNAYEQSLLVALSAVAAEFGDKLTQSDGEKIREEIDKRMKALGLHPTQLRGNRGLSPKRSNTKSVKGTFA